MKPYPHHYTASASGRTIGSVVICAPALPPIATAPPPEFDGPGGAWSPETLLCAAVANCFILTFRGIARAAHFNWIAIDCHVEGRLERVEEKTQFTRFTTKVRLTVPPGSDTAKARLLVARTEQSCLIANSLRGERALSLDIATAEGATETRECPVECGADENFGERARPNELRTETEQLS